MWMGIHRSRIIAQLNDGHGRGRDFTPFAQVAFVSGLFGIQTAAWSLQDCPNRNGRAFPIDEHLLAWFVTLTRHRVELIAPALIQLAEARVAITIRSGLAIFLPQQLERHVLVVSQLLVNRGEVRRRTRGSWLLGVSGAACRNIACSTRASSQSSGRGQVTPAAVKKVRPGPLHQAYQLKGGIDLESVIRRLDSVRAEINLRLATMMRRVNEHAEHQFTTRYFGPFMPIHFVELG